MVTAGTFQLLSESPDEQKRRRVSFLAACIAEAAAVALLTVVCAYYAKTAAAHVRRYVVLTYSSSVEQELRAKPPELRKAAPKAIVPYVLPHPRVELPRVNEPQIRADVRVPMVKNQPVTPSPAVAEPPRLTPPPPAIHTGLFGQTPEKQATENPPRVLVQTGGFGAPQGVAGQAQGGNHGNVAKLGSFDLAAGPGIGNGSGGAEGRPQTVADAGFGSRREVTSINEIGESDKSNRIAASGFGNGGVGLEGGGGSAHGASAAVRTGAFAAPRLAATRPKR